MALSSLQTLGTEFKPEQLDSGGEMGSFDLSVPRFPTCERVINAAYLTEIVGDKYT